MKHGVSPPTVIQYELDIDEENHEDDNNGAPIIMVEEAQPDETEDEKQKREQLEKLSIQIKELEGDIKAEVGEDGDADGDESDGTMSPPTTGSNAVTAAEQAQRNAKQTKKASSRARREKAKAKYQQLKEAQMLEGQMSGARSGEKYKAIKGDVIDEAVQRAVNDPDTKFYNFIRIRRAKKLGKAASAKRSKREKEGGGIYRVGTAHKVHVRLMQEMLFVRQGNQWVDFNLFVHDQIDADKRAHDRVHAEGGEGAKMVWVPKGTSTSSATS